MAAPALVRILGVGPDTAVALLISKVAMARRVMNATSPTPVWSAVLPSMSKRPLPSSRRSMSDQMRTAASERRKPQLRSTSTRAMSTMPRWSARSGFSMHRRSRSLGNRTVARMASIALLSSSGRPDLEIAVRTTGLSLSGRNLGLKRCALNTLNGQAFLFILGLLSCFFRSQVPPAGILGSQFTGTGHCRVVN